MFWYFLLETRRHAQYSGHCHRDGGVSPPLNDVFCFSVISALSCLFACLLVWLFACLIVCLFDCLLCMCKGLSLRLEHSRWIVDGRFPCDMTLSVICNLLSFLLFFFLSIAEWWPTQRCAAEKLRPAVFLLLCLPTGSVVQKYKGMWRCLWLSNNFNTTTWCICCIASRE